MVLKGKTDRDGRVKHREKHPMNLEIEKKHIRMCKQYGKIEKEKMQLNRSVNSAENDAHVRECRRSARTRTRDCGSMRYRNTRWRTSRKRCSGTEEARTKDSLSRRVNRERVRFEILIFDFLIFFHILSVSSGGVRFRNGARGGRGTWGRFDGSGMRGVTGAIGRAEPEVCASLCESGCWF
jgi:hypothetical protein